MNIHSETVKNVAYIKMKLHKKFKSFMKFLTFPCARKKMNLHIYSIDKYIDETATFSSGKT